MEHMTATDGIAIHHGDNRLRQAANLHLYIEHVETRHTIVAYISTPALHMHITTGTERLVASTRQDNHTDIQTVTTVVESLRHLPGSQWSEGVAITLTIDGNLSNVIILLEDDFLEIKTFYLFPFSHI